MDSIHDFYGRHGVALTLIILGVIAVIWVWILLRIAKFGRERYGLRLIVSWSMALIFIGFVGFVLGFVFHPTECAQPCDLSLLNREHFQIFGAVVGVASLLALIINIRKSNPVFGLIFTMTQASIAFFAVILMFLLMVTGDESKERRS